MITTPCRLFASVVLTLPLCAQQQSFLFTPSLGQISVSGSGGTGLTYLYPNEIHQLEFPAGCNGVSAEKWAPRTCFHAMAGDENSDAAYWNASLFGRVDGLVTVSQFTGAGANQRTVFWSPQLAMGTGVSLAPGLRPGDTGRIVRTTAGDGQVEYFLRQEQVNQALGLPLTNPLDVDAIAFAPQFGVFFSLDADVNVSTACGNFLLRDGDVVAIPAYAMTYTTDLRIATVAAGSAVVVHTEAAMDAFVLAAQVTNHVGFNLVTGTDTESLDIDWNSNPTTWQPGCVGLAFQVPDFLFSTEAMTGASILTTAGGGSIWNGPCGPMGTSWNNGPTWGTQSGLLGFGPFVYSYINALAGEQVCRYVLEPRTPQITPGSPAGASQIDVASPAALNFVFLHFAPAGFNAVPASSPWPFNLSCFPDCYLPATFYMIVATPNGFGTFPSPAIPANFNCKLLFESVAILNGNLVISTPAMLDVS